MWFLDYVDDDEAIRAEYQRDKDRPGGTITAALRAVQEEAQSPLPALGYTVPYALGNILLTAWGPVLVAVGELPAVGKPAHGDRDRAAAGGTA